VQKLINLRHLREHAALTQAETAERAGIAESTYRYIENLEVSPRPLTVRKIAGALEVEPHELWESEAPKAEAPSRSPSPKEAAGPGLDDLDIASLLKLNITLSEDIARAREEGDQQRLDVLYDQLWGVSQAINRKGPFTETAASAKRRRRQKAQEEAGETTAEAG
jgi:transcriptional regulator with XRE-family HTH domain